VGALSVEVVHQIAPFLASPDVCDIATPGLVWATDAELTIQSIGNVWYLYCCLFVCMRPWLFADQPQFTHQSTNLEASNQNVFVVEHGGDHPASCRASTLAKYPVYISSQNHSFDIKRAVVDSTGQCNIMHFGVLRSFHDATARLKNQRTNAAAETGAMGKVEKRSVAQ
jgi:hypothetical protein